MRSPEGRVVVTGLGMVTPFGVGQRAFWAGVLASRSAAREIRSFKTAGYPTRFACQVDDAGFDPGRYLRNRKSLKLMGRATRLGVAAAALALEDAGLPQVLPEPRRAGIVMGVGGVGHHDLDYLEVMTEVAVEMRAAGAEADVLSIVGRHMNPLTTLMLLPNITATHIGIEHDLRGESATVCTACTSATQAIGEAVRVLRAGRVDVMLAGGTDAMINPVGVAAFGMLGVLSRRNEAPEKASRPFDRARDGFVMGEGAVVLAIEALPHALKRDAPILAEVIGYGAAADAYRVTDEPEDGHGSIDAMRAALADAAVSPSAVQCLNAHGTGTRMNDIVETRALRAVFGEHLRTVAVSSTKSQVGHLVAAAGAVETAACVLALVHQTVPPSINLDDPDPACEGLDLVANLPRQTHLDVVVKNSFGFGGQNACLVLRRWQAQ